jgi:hypothetical protein
MATRSPEGGNPFNIDPKTVRIAPEQRRFHGVKKQEAPKQQPSDPDREGNERLTRRPGRSILAGGESPIRNQRLLREGTEQRAEVQLEQTHHQEHPVESLGELRQLARRALKPPMSPEQLEGIKPEDFEEWARNHPYHAANYATAMLYYEEEIEHLAQSMAKDPLHVLATTQCVGQRPMNCWLACYKLAGCSALSSLLRIQRTLGLRERCSQLF